MKKILLAVDAVHPNKNTLEFACYLGRLTRSKVTGVFLECMEEETEPPASKHVQDTKYVNWEMDPQSGAQPAAASCIDQHIRYFKEGCVNREVNYRLHLDRGIPAVELVEESRFADMMVLDAETSFKKSFEGTPTAFVKEVLKNAHCPVILAPDNFEAIDEIVFTYDGSPSSLFAIKQFTYLFPQFCSTKVSILQMNETGTFHHSDRLKLKEWLREHYTALQFESIKGADDFDLFNYLFKRKNMFLVMGAYSRNALSQFFKRSHADILIKTIMQPIFITHR